VFLPLAVLAHAGWIGVQLFFVLSGFLITRNLFALRGTENYFRTFFGRRVLRIFPLYFSALIVAFVIVPQLVNLDAKTLASQTHQIWLWTFLSNWVQPFGLGVDGFSHFWSLAVEEQFYLIWPLVILVCNAPRVRSICLILAVMALLIRIGCVAGGVRPEIPYMFTVCRMDALALGAIIATLTTSSARVSWLSARPTQWLLLIVMVLVLVGLSTHVFNAFDYLTLTMGQTALSIGFAMIVWLIVELELTHKAHWLLRLLNTKALRSIGKYSFAMYVFHLPIAIAMEPWLARHLASTDVYFGVVNSLLVIIAAYLASAVSYHALEKHFLRLKVYFGGNVTSESRS